MKSKTAKKILLIVLIVLGAAILLMGIDTSVCLGGGKPVFSFCPMTADDGGSGTYFGLLYSLEIHGDYTPEGYGTRALTLRLFYFLPILNYNK